MSNPVLTIAKHELVTRGRSKPFLLFTGFLIAIAIVVAVIIRFLGGEAVTELTGRSVRVGVTSTAEQYEDVLVINAPFALNVITKPVTGDGLQELADEEVDVVFDGETLYWNGLPDLELDLQIRSTVQQQEVLERAEALELGPKDLETLLTPRELGEERLDDGGVEQGIRLGAALASGVAIFMVLTFWGSSLMGGVVEEKTTRVVEILLAQVKPQNLLAGKVLGIGGLALIQMSVIIIGLLVALSLIRDVELPDGLLAIVPLLAATFLLGFVFHATFYAAIGSTVSRPEDLGKAQLPSIVTMSATYGIGYGAISEPESILLTIGSFVPFTSPVFLPVRYALGTMPIWQAILSLAILAVSSVVMIKVAGEIYRYSLLRTGSRVRLLHAWRDRANSDV